MRRSQKVKSGVKSISSRRTGTCKGPRQQRTEEELKRPAWLTVSGEAVGRGVE